MTIRRVTLATGTLVLVALAFTISTRRIPPLIDASVLDVLGSIDLIPPGVHVAGDVESETSIVMFSDLECPFCQADYNAIRGLLTKRRFRLVFRHFPLNSHKNAKLAARLAELLPDDKAFWRYLDACYSMRFRTEGEYLDEAIHLGLGHRGGQTPNKASDAATAIMRRDTQLGARLHLRGVPCLVLVRPHEKPRLVALEEVESL